MSLLYAFLFSGIMCAIAQIILDNTKLTPGHITSLFTVLGSLLGFLGIYDIIISYAGAGATSLISNFGNALYNGGISGYKSSGFIGIFSGMLTNSSAIITSAIVFAFIFSVIFKPKD